MPSNVTVLFSPQPPHHRHLFGQSPAAVGEVLAERLVLDGIPAEPDSEAQPSLAEQIDLGGLFGDEHRLALREDDDAGHQLQRGGDGGQVAEHHQRFVEGRVHVVRPRPADVNRGVGADDVVVGQQVGVTQLLYALAVRAHR